MFLSLGRIYGAASLGLACVLVAASLGCAPSPQESPVPTPEETHETEAEETHEATAEETHEVATVGTVPGEPTTSFEPLIVSPTTLPGVGGYTHRILLDAIGTGRGREFKPVGHSSIVFRVRLPSPHMAAYRPRTRQHRRGHLAEVGAYAIGRLLGLDNVVPATLRTMSRREIADHLHRRHASGEEWDPLAARIFYRTRFETPGASVYWVPELREADLDQPTNRRAWGAILSENPPMDMEQTQLMRDLSNMRVFDYLIANWDRFSGGNLKVFALTTPRVALRDHNISFGRLAPGRGDQLREAVRQTTMFSRDMIARLARLDETAISTALATLNSEEERGQLAGPILTPAQTAALLERAAVILSHVAALIEAHGDARILAFD